MGISFTDNQIGDKGAESIAAALKVNATLQVLDLQGILVILCSSSFSIDNQIGAAMMKKVDEVMKDIKGRETGQQMCQHSTLFIYWTLKQIIPLDIAKLISSKKKRWILTDNGFNLLSEITSISLPPLPKFNIPKEKILKKRKTVI